LKLQRKPYLKQTLQEESTGFLGGIRTAQLLLKRKETAREYTIVTLLPKIYSISRLPEPQQEEPSTKLDGHIGGTTYLKSTPEYHPPYYGNVYALLMEKRDMNLSLHSELTEENYLAP